MPTATANVCRITLGDPVVVAQAPADMRGWGPYQFPFIERLADGRLHITYHIEADSATAYGKPVGHAYSTDDGKSWVVSKELEGAGGILLANGDRLCVSQQSALPLTDLKLPAPLYDFKGTYHAGYQLYTRAQVPAKIRGYRLLRLKKGSQAWTEEFATVRMPEELYMASEGVLAISFFDWGIHWHLAPDGTLLVIGYPPRRMPKAARTTLGEYKWAAVVLRSRDNGKSFDLAGEIPYQPDTKADKHWLKREGFTEPDCCFLPDQSLFCLLRTEDGNGTGPLYSARSLDHGRTWSKPAIFDDRGVWPILLPLPNGITLATYGRPGLFVRASADPAGKAWDSRVEIVKPEAGEHSMNMTGTCSYSALLALDDSSALMVYSDFNWPDEKGIKRKTILVRTVKAER